MKKLFTGLLLTLCCSLHAQPVPPAALASSTYLGGGGINYTTDVGYSVAVGGDGAVYVLGQTSSEPFPHTAVIGGFDTG